MVAEKQDIESFTTTVEFGLVASPSKLTITVDGIHIFVSRLLSGMASQRSDYDLPRKKIRRIYRRTNIMGRPCIWVDYRIGEYDETLYLHPPDINALTEALESFGFSVDAF